MTDTDDTSPPIYCISCGAEVPSKAEFCPICGEVIDIVGRK